LIKIILTIKTKRNMKAIFKVEQSDLVGGIKDFPIEVVEKMIEEQVKQGKKADVEVFQKNASTDTEEGGFDWMKTEQGYEFWDEVIGVGNFDLFFKKYPKKANLVYIAGDSEIGMDIIKTLEKYGGINEHNYKGDRDDVVYYIEPNNKFIEVCDFEVNIKLWDVLLATYTSIDAEQIILEVTMEEIAEKFGVDVSNLRIKG
jgi:hypothetical protein